MHPSSWLQYNPFYDLFYSTTNLAATVAVILALALFVALGRRHKEAAIGLSVGLALMTATVTVLNISDKNVDAGFNTNMATGHYGAPVTGVQFIGTPVVMTVAAVALFVLAGRFAWVEGRTASTKLTIVITFLLGASLFGTFAAQLAQDMYNVGGYYWSNWADFGSWLWAADFVLTCALAIVILSIGIRRGVQYLRANYSIRVLPFWHDDADSTKTLHRTADATAAA